MQDESKVSTRERNGAQIEYKVRSQRHSYSTCYCAGILFVDLLNRKGHRTALSHSLASVAGELRGKYGFSHRQDKRMAFRTCSDSTYHHRAISLEAKNRGSLWKTRGKLIGDEQYNEARKALFEDRLTLKDFFKGKLKS